MSFPSNGLGCIFLSREMAADGGAGAAVPVCEEKDRLQKAYRVANGDFIRAVAVLNKRTAVMVKKDYARMRQYVEEARVRCREARAALDRHSEEHGC